MGRRGRRLQDGSFADGRAAGRERQSDCRDGWSGIRRPWVSGRLRYATGKRAWRLWTVPGPGEPGNQTWSGDSWMHGGATTWVTGAFDPETNLAYWGTGNPGPDYIGDVRAGDNLYADSLIAVDVDTGALRWHFQFTPHDVNDIDATEIPILIDADFRGRPRKLLLFANRNGFFYIFDRVTGEYLHAKAFARQTWTKGLDAKGRPIPNPDTVPSAKGALVYPDDDGVTNWFSPSHSPQTKTFYQNVREKGGIYFRNEAVYQPGRMYLGASKRPVPDEVPWGALRALDPLSGDVKWEFKVTTPPWCGLLSTAGGLVFSGTMEGMFFALDAESGKLLWRFQTGGAIWSNPISYQAGGHQYSPSRRATRSWCSACRRRDRSSLLREPLPQLGVWTGLFGEEPSVKEPPYPACGCSRPNSR